MSSNGYHALGRRDLGGFNEEAIAIITAATNLGATGRVSNRGHAIIRGPNGQTMSVSKDPTKANRGLQNQLSDFRRIFGMEPSEALKRKEGPVPTTAIPQQQGVKPSLIRCEAKGCNQTFVTEGARYSHVQRDHVPCRVPGCQFPAVDKRGEAAHYRMHHKGEAATQRQGKPAKKEVEVTPAVTETRTTELEKQLSRIRDVLGPDPRVKDLQARLEECHARNEVLKKELGELQAKLKLMKEALEL